MRGPIIGLGICVRLLANDPETLYQRGVELFQNGEIDKAAGVFAAVVEKDSRHARAWKALGVSRAAVGDHDLAAEPFKRACRLEPALEDACFYFARNLYLRHRFEDSLEELARLKPGRKIWRISHLRGLNNEALGNWKAAEDDLRLSIEQSEAKSTRPDTEPRFSYGVFLLSRGRTAEALQWLDRAVARHPRVAKAHFERGRALYQLGRLEEAKRAVERALSLDSSMELARLLLPKITSRMAAK